MERAETILEVGIGDVAETVSSGTFHSRAVCRQSPGILGIDDPAEFRVAKFPLAN
jgi:hypothetical protein